MQQIINALIWIGNVVRSFWLPISIILGFIADPGGTVSFFACKILTFIFVFFPSTPEPLRLGNLFDDMLTSLDNTFPLIGGGVLNEVFTTITSVLLIIISIKVYKLIPFI